MPTIPEEIPAARCIAMTTCKRDGTAITTPVWFHVTDGKIYATSRSTAAKLKRIRNNPRVLYAVCTQRGRVTGPMHEGEARVLDAAGSDRVLDDKKRRYRSVRILSALPLRTFTDQVAFEITPLD